MPLEWAQSRSTARCVLPVLVGPKTAVIAERANWPIGHRLPFPGGEARGNLGVAPMLWDGLALLRIWVAGNVALTIGRYAGAMVIRRQHPLFWGLCGALLLAGPALALRLTPAPMVQRPALSVPRLVVPPDRSLDQPVRFSGRVTNGLYASLRAAGMGIYPAQQSVKALGAHIDFATDMMADTQFDVVLGNGGRPEAAVLYIGVSQPGRRVQLVPMSTQGETRWQNIAGPGESATGLIRPVPEAQLSSGFGVRWHPLLGYSRFHKGVDYAAAWGTPIHAVADGRVSRAGWAGGYGQMVRLAHADQVETGYAHMSRLAVAAGAQVRQGQVIGYVGSTGLSTGPHLHFEISRAGVAMDPAEVRHIGQPGLSVAQRQALRGRVQRLLAQAISAPPPGG